MVYILSSSARHPACGQLFARGHACAGL